MWIRPIQRFAFTTPIATLGTQGYATGLWDPTSGLLKLGQRYLDTTTGTFTQQDSLTHLGNPTNGNRYAYAADNPTTYEDPTGQNPACDASTFLGGLVASSVLTIGLGSVAGPAGVGIGLIGSADIATGMMGLDEACNAQFG